MKVLGYDALREVAKKIATSLKDSKVLDSGGIVYLAGTTDQLQTTGLRLLVKGKLAAYEEAFKNLEESEPKDGHRLESALTALAMTRGSIGLAADIATFFQQDRDIKGRDMEVDSQLMMKTVAGAWTSGQNTPSVKFVNPAAIVKVAPADKAKNVLGLFERLESRYVEMIALRDKVARKTEQLKVDLAARTEALAALRQAAGATPTAEQVTEITAQSKGIRIVDGEIRVAGDYLESAKSILTSYRTFADSLLVIAQGKNESLLASIFGNDIIASNPDTGFLLEVSVAAIGGEMELRKWLWSPGKVHHRAGAVCHYALWDDTGILRASGLVGADVQVVEGKKETKVSILQ